MEKYMKQICTSWGDIIFIILFNRKKIFSLTIPYWYNVKEWQKEFSRLHAIAHIIFIYLTYPFSLPISLFPLLRGKFR